MGSRATWKGTLTVSLVSVPIKVYPATETSDGLKFNQLHESCQGRVTQKRWCEVCAREVPTAEIVKGFEFEPGKYVLLLPAELDAVQPPSTRVIDLVQFSPITALELRAIDRAYYVMPEGEADGPAAESYAVLCAAMRGLVGIGKLAIYNREYLVGVTPQGRTLMLYTLHHAAELRTLEEIVVPVALDRVGRAALGGIRSTELALACGLIEGLARPLSLAAFEDAYQQDLRRLIDGKIAGQEVVIPPVETPPQLPLLEALRQSLEAVSAGKKPPAKARTPERRKRA